MGSRLFLKIYLTVLGSLALVVIALSTLAFLGRLDTRSPFEDRVDRFASVMLSSDLSFDQRQAMLEKLSNAFDADIAIYAADGKILQGAGDPRFNTQNADAMPKRRHFRVFSAILPDGSRFVASVRRPFVPPRGNLIISFLVIAALIGVAAYPVVRHLTRRLDQMRTSMENWGSGTLAERVPVSGKDEIATVARTFNLAADRIETLVNSQRNLLANASHELRSPLARLRMAIEMFEVSQSQPTKNEIIRNLAELDELVEEILLKSRLDGDRPPPLDQPIDLLALAAEEAAFADADVEGDEIRLTGNERMIRRLIRNLLQNAIRHGKPPVGIAVRNKGDVAEIRVQDHGSGLKSEDAERVFEPFYRPPGRSETDGGWGLGLALVAEIARFHGGRAYAAQPAETGAVFVVELPLGASHL
ncbi:HAMP domain-containing histidine kinase [Rhizobium sp. KVB221]|uniref:histidine kinase n=1 Tax=Rhizobium setariae TaxID=2801340 RepID=A0A936YU54_9HYPH|nr:HAMP domain-containing histidine kinase [Rhizobium setariae]